MAQPKTTGAPSAIERRLLDGLAEHLGPRDARRMLRRALALAEVTAVPDERGGLGVFICGALTEALDETLETREVEAILDRLDPLFAPTDARSSGVRRQTPKILNRCVLLLSSSGAHTSGLKERLRGKVEMRRVADVFSLLAEIDTLSAEELVIVVADDAPSIGGPILETLQRAVPPTAEVVFWGSEPPEAFRLPYTSVSTGEESDEVAEVCLRGSTAAADRPRVVIADPDPVWRASLERALRRTGYDVTAAANGFEALEACIDQGPALVVTDYRMPLIDGVRLAALLAARFSPSPPPIVMVTASRIQPPADIAVFLRKDTPLEAIVSAVRERVSVEEDRT